MKSKSTWIRAEDSFLKQFCSVTEREWGQIYQWSVAPQWPKFNFIRFNVEQVQGDLVSEAIQLYKTQPGYSQTKAFLRLPANLKVSTDVQAIIRRETGGIMAATYDMSSSQLNGDLRFAEVDSRELLKTWWEINSNGRARENIFHSPLWPVIERKFADGTKFFLLYAHTTPVACVAADLFDDGVNTWGLATRAEFQMRGIAKAALGHLARCYPGKHHCQLGYSGHMHIFLQREASAQILESEQFYVEVG